MRGQPIVVKEFNGLPLVVQVWISVIQAFLARRNSASGLMARNPLIQWASPHEDVFECDKTAQEQLRKDRVDWEKLNPLRLPATAR